MYKITIVYKFQCYSYINLLKKKICLGHIKIKPNLLKRRHPGLQPSSLDSLNGL